MSLILISTVSVFFCFLILSFVCIMLNCNQDLSSYGSFVLEVFHNHIHFVLQLDFIWCFACFVFFQVFPFFLYCLFSRQYYIVSLFCPLPILYTELLFCQRPLRDWFLSLVDFQCIPEWFSRKAEGF